MCVCVCVCARARVCVVCMCVPTYTSTRAYIEVKFSVTLIRAIDDFEDTREIVHLWGHVCVCVCVCVCMSARACMCAFERINYTLPPTHTPSPHPTHTRTLISGASGKSGFTSRCFSHAV